MHAGRGFGSDSDLTWANSAFAADAREDRLSLPKGRKSSHTTLSSQDIVYDIELFGNRSAHGRWCKGTMTRRYEIHPLDHYLKRIAKQYCSRALNFAQISSAIA